MKNNLKLYLLCTIILLMPIINNSISHANDINGKAWIEKRENIDIIGIHLSINNGAYLYHTDLGDQNALGTPLKISISSDTYKILGFTTSPPKVKMKQSFAKANSFYKVNVHTNSMYIYLKIKKNNISDMGLTSDNQKLKEIKVNLNGQLCNKRRCLQFSLVLPVKDSASSTEAANTFSLMPDLNKFTKPLPEWSKLNTSSKHSPTAVIPSIYNANIKQASTSVNPIKSFNKTPPLLETLSQQINNDNSLSGLPKFHIHKDTRKYSVIAWLGIALLAGILLNFMPCVLPVISLKIIGFVNQAHENKKRLILLSLCFSSGIISIFLVLALAVAGFGMQWGEQFQSETFNIILACLIFAFALSFFGVFEFSAPAFAGKLQSGKTLPREGYLGAYFTGVVATLMATPCSGPFLGATISWALTQKTIIIFTVFLFIGIGMALPYFLLSLNDRLRKLLPKPGAWMITFRTIMGFILMLTVTYLMLFIRNENLIATCMLMVFIAFSCWIYGKYASIIHLKKTRWIARICSFTILAIGIYLTFGILNSFISTTKITDQNIQTITASSGISNEHQILPFNFKSFKQNLSNGKNILVDFTADWCPNCQYNTHYVFLSELVQNKLKSKNVIFYTADLTEDTPHTQKIRDFLKLLGGSAIPYASIFSANNPSSPYVLPDILSISKVSAILDKLPNTQKH